MKLKLNWNFQSCWGGGGGGINQDIDIVLDSFLALKTKTSVVEIWVFFGTTQCKCNAS